MSLSVELLYCDAFYSMDFDIPCVGEIIWTSVFGEEFHYHCEPNLVYAPQLHTVLNKKTIVGNIKSGY